MAETSIRDSTRRAGAKLPLTVLGLVALTASAVFAANPFGVRERVLGSKTPKARPAAVSRLADATTATTAKPQNTMLRSQPWWQGVATLEGVGTTTTAPFTIGDGAVQWRVKWTCDRGHLVARAPTGVRPVVDVNCPGGGTGYGTRTGNMSLQVTADGPWRLVVEQQVDVPLEEPPLPAMSAPGATAVATGSFYRIDQSGTGRVTVYRLADGSYALRLDDFYVTPNVDLEIKLSPREAPQSTDDFTSAPSASVASLDVTAGSLNFTVPQSVDPTRYRSVVIWCEPVRSAYAAATLTAVR